MANFCSCDLKVVGEDKGCKKVLKKLKEAALWDNIDIEKVDNGVYEVYLTIKWGLEYYLLNENEKNNLLDLSEKHRLDIELFGENEEGCNFEYFLVKKGHIVSKKLNEYYYFHDLEDVEDFVEEYDYLTIEDFIEEDDTYYFGKMDIEFTI